MQREVSVQIFADNIKIQQATLYFVAEFKIVVQSGYKTIRLKFIYAHYIGISC